jgi:hypothetical protein
MASRKVAYLMPFYFDERLWLAGSERYPLNRARGLAECSRRDYEAEPISYGDAALRRPLRPGITLRVLTAAGRPCNRLDMMSWELPDVVAEAVGVHIRQAYSRCAEMGLLVAKHRKPLGATDHGSSTSALGKQVGAADAAGRIGEIGPGFPDGERSPRPQAGKIPER